MTVIKLSALAAGVIGGAMALSGATPASAATLAPALAQTQAQTGEFAGVQQVDHNRRTRPGWAGLRSSRSYGPNYGYRYGRSGPSVSFGLNAPGFSFGIGTPRSYSYGYSPYGYSYNPYGYGYSRRGYYGY